MNLGVTKNVETFLQAERPLAAPNKTRHFLREDSYNTDTMLHFLPLSIQTNEVASEFGSLPILESIPTWILRNYHCFPPSPRKNSV